jgi:hypothetical protein
MGTRVEEKGMGELNEWAVVVVAEDCTAAGIDLWASSRAGVAFLLFVGGGMTGSRPKDRPTADAPTTVAVAQSCVTTMRQSRIQDTQSTTETTKAAAALGSRAVETLRVCKGKRRCSGRGCRRRERKIVTVGTDFILDYSSRRLGKLTRRSTQDARSIMASRGREFGSRETGGLLGRREQCTLAESADYDRQERVKRRVARSGE